MPGHHGRDEGDHQREHDRAVGVAEHEVGRRHGSHHHCHERDPGTRHQGQGDRAGQQQHHRKQVEGASFRLGAGGAEAAHQLHHRQRDGKHHLRRPAGAPRAAARPRRTPAGIRRGGPAIAPVPDPPRGRRPARVACGGWARACDQRRDDGRRRSSCRRRTRAYSCGSTSGRHQPGAAREQRRLERGRGCGSWRARCPHGSSPCWSTGAAGRRSRCCSAPGRSGRGRPTPVATGRTSGSPAPAAGRPPGRGRAPPGSPRERGWSRRRRRPAPPGRGRHRCTA